MIINYYNDSTQSREYPLMFINIPNISARGETKISTMIFILNKC